jgi:oligopeptidase B
VDEFHWMRLSEEQRNAADPDAHTQKVVAHHTAENGYTEAMLAPVKELKETLFQEMKGRMKETDLSVPYRENGYWYHYRFEEGKEYPIHVRRADVPDATEEDFLNENLLATGSTYFDLGDFEVSPSNRIVGYSVDLVGRRQYDIRFRDLATGADLPDVITNTGGGCAFADERTVFYPRKDSTLRSYRIYRHISRFFEVTHDTVLYHPSWEPVERIYILNLEERVDRYYDTLLALARLQAQIKGLYPWATS